MIDIKKYRSHIGKCLVGNVDQQYWINIPKNASNSISYHLLTQKKWKDGNWLIDTDIKNFQGVVVLKDPLDRWRGSTLELCYHFIERNDWKIDNFDFWFYKKNFFEFDRSLDLHHVRQVDFLQALDCDKLKFVYIDTNFEQNICSALNITAPLKQLNLSSENQYKKMISSYVSDMLLDSKLIEKIKLFYEDDYRLIEKINPS